MEPYRFEIVSGTTTLGELWQWLNRTVFVTGGDVEISWEVTTFEDSEWKTVVALKVSPYEH